MLIFLYFNTRPFIVKEKATDIEEVVVLLISDYTRSFIGAIAVGYFMYKLLADDY